MDYPVNNYKKDPESLHLYVRGIRILTPKDYEKLKDSIPNDRHKTILEVLLVTGMRYAELLRLYDHKEWYNEKRNIIHLPEEAQRKHKRKQLERTIHPLPYGFNYVLNAFWKGRKPPMEPTWNQNMQRWAKNAGLSPFGMTVKSTRKTAESWMIVGGVLVFSVCLRQGHDTVTSLRHYQGLAFSDDEVRDIKNKLISWGFRLEEK